MILFDTEYFVIHRLVLVITSSSAETAAAELIKVTN